MFRFFENIVDPYCDYPETDKPPTKLLPFLLDYSRPFQKLFTLTAVVSVVVAAVELWLIYYMGRVVDLLATGSPEEVLALYGW